MICVIMPGSDRQITVFMVPDGADAEDGEGGYRTYRNLDIDDYGTPLGVPESILGGGEIIE